MNIVRGACGHDCPDTCSWIVEVHDGTAEKLFGDPAHPFTRGTLCAKVNHYLDRVYHPDRVLHPLKRVGRRVRRGLNASVGTRHSGHRIAMEKRSWTNRVPRRSCRTARRASRE